MDDERYKQLMNYVGLPDSRSLLDALKQVANEVEQEVLARPRVERTTSELLAEIRSSGHCHFEWINSRGEIEAVNAKRVQEELRAHALELESLRAEAARLRALLWRIRPYVYGIENLKEIDVVLGRAPIDDPEPGAR